MTDHVEDTAWQLWTDAEEHEQAVRRVLDDTQAAAIRARVRRLASEAGVRVRTARMGDLIAVVRLDAAIWTDDTPTMRRKLTAPGSI